MNDIYMICGTCDNYCMQDAKCLNDNCPHKWEDECCSEFTLASKTERQKRGSIAIEIGKIKQSISESDKQ